MDTPDLITLLVWLGIVAIAGVLMWEWGADWYEEFRHDDDAWWESLTDQAKQALQDEVKSHGERLDKHDERIDALDDCTVTVESDNESIRNQSKSQ